MKVGDLVKFKGPQKKAPGTLQAAKYFTRMAKRMGQLPGLVIWTDGENCLVKIINDQVTIRCEYLELINE
tara:strand:- start:68 stop:277 length:210 start_codon:yes stop_codon:yes gene_type:complete